MVTYGVGLRPYFKVTASAVVRLCYMKYKLVKFNGYANWDIYKHITLTTAFKHSYTLPQKMYATRKAMRNWLTICRFFKLHIYSATFTFSNDRIDKMQAFRKYIRRHITAYTLYPDSTQERYHLHGFIALEKPISKEFYKYTKDGWGYIGIYDLYGFVFFREIKQEEEEAKVRYAVKYSTKIKKNNERLLTKSYTHWYNAVV